MEWIPTQQRYPAVSPVFTAASQLRLGEESREITSEGVAEEFWPVLSEGVVKLRSRRDFSVEGVSRLEVQIMCLSHGTFLRSYKYKSSFSVRCLCPLKAMTSYPYIDI